MEPETAQMVVISITAIGAVAWMAALTTVLKASRERRESARLATERFDVEGDFAPGTIVGEAEVDGEPEELSARLAGLLAREGMGPFGPVKIVAQDRDQVAFEPAGASMTGFRAGRVRFTAKGPRTRVEYAIECSTGGLMLGAWIALGLGLAALIAAPTLAFLVVLPSPNPAVRVQSIQAFQMVHFLWPPFLFAFLSRQRSRMFRARIESLVHNLPYT